MKLAEIREKSVEELQNTIIDYKKQLFDLRFKKHSYAIDMNELPRTNSQMKKLRREIAQIKTVINEKSKEVIKNA